MELVGLLIVRYIGPSACVVSLLWRITVAVERIAGRLDHS